MGCELVIVYVVFFLIIMLKFKTSLIRKFFEELKNFM